MFEEYKGSYESQRYQYAVVTLLEQINEKLDRIIELKDTPKKIKKKGDE